MLILCCSKELKDPDQLYNTLKNLLAQIKVKAGGDLPLWADHPHLEQHPLGQAVLWDSWGDLGTWVAGPSCAEAHRGCLCSLL